MKAFSVLALVSPIMAATIGRAVGSSSDQASHAIVERDDIFTQCGFPAPSNELVASAYDYPIGALLSAAGKTIHIDAGPSNCKQVICGSKSGGGVYVCNDNTHAVDLLYSDIGFFAQQVYNTCKHRRDDIDYVQKGQSFCPDSWNVILSDIGSNCQVPEIPNKTE
ncbi:hypothetical protein F5Y11DRAFT_329492 [Daldinia sp. FL1419]|nr:hypothetical protein F5Y11DRAFT_329492 [Daldinia sp. FL1419]